MSDKRRNFRLTFAVTTVILAAIAVFAVMVLGNIPGARLDLTQDKLFTMSPAAGTILEGLQVPVQVKLYITPEAKMPTEFKNLERDVTEQLRNYERVSNGQLQFSVHNPQNDEDMQQELAQKGIQPFQVQSVDKDEIGVKLIWSALTIAYKDNPEEVVPRVLPQTLTNLETLVISPVHRLTRERDPIVAVFAPPKPVDQQMAMMYLQQGMQPPAPQDIYTLIAQLLQQEHYAVAPITLTEDSPIPADADLLLIIGPRDLNARQSWEINRALSNGMPVLMAVQAHEYSYNPGQQGQLTVQGAPTSSGLDPMLAGLGLGLVQDHFMDANFQVLEIPREINLGGMRMQVREPVSAPVQVKVTQDQINQDMPVTNHLATLLYLWGTPVTVDAARLSDHGLTSQTLITSSANSWQADFGSGVLSSSQMDPRGKDLLGPQPLAVLVEGSFPDTYAATGAPDWPAQPSAPEEVPQVGPSAATPLNPQDGQLLLIGCAKMFEDTALQGAQNALLLLNAVDFLAGSEELLSIRSKLLTQRTIRPVSSGEKIIWQIIAVALMPIAFIILGVVRNARRREAAARYRRSLNA